MGTTSVTCAPGSEERPARLGAALLGVVVGWQFVFVPLGNLVDHIPADAPPPLAVARTGLERWGQLTGHFQTWPLFPGALPITSAYPAAELHFPNGSTAEVRSRFEPADPGRPGRFPGLANRVFNHEIGLIAAHEVMTPELVSRYPDEWPTLLADQVRQKEPYIRAYLARAAAGANSTELVLVVRQYRTDRPSRPAELVVRPAARWRPSEPVPPGYLAVEVFDPVAGRFIPVRAELSP